MNLIKQCWGWQLLRRTVIFGSATTLVGCFAIAFSRNCAWGQVIGDTTLGAENSKVTSPIPGGFLIEGGATRGTNLFHSFQEFSVPTNGIAFFNNAIDIQNILSRVTGTSVSNIDGLIASNGTANLFLINPNGIVFGRNASLDIGGSFLASTARSVLFANGYQFSAIQPQAPPLLTVNVPVGLQYGGNPRSVQLQESVLQVHNGKTLALVGGEVLLNGTTLQAFGGRVELAGVGSTGMIGLNENGNNLNLTVPNETPRANVSLTNGATVRVVADSGGSIAINALNLNVVRGSKLLAGIASGSGSIDSRAGDVEINTTQTTNLTDGSFIGNALLPGGMGKAGNINITTGSFSVTNGAVLATSTVGRGDAGNVNITASDTVSFDGGNSNGNSSTVFSTVESGAVGNGGDINIITDSLAITNGAQLLASTFGRGNAGNVNITANNSVSVNGADSNVLTAVASTVEFRAVGNGGNVNITTGSLSVSNRAQLQALTRGQGNAGNINIASERVSFDGTGSNGIITGASSTVESRAVGNGGNVNIMTDSLSVTNGAELQALTRGQGNAGSVNITATDTVSFDGAIAISSAESKTGGNGGDINITTGSLSLSNGAQLTASTFERGNAGSVNITASRSVAFDGVSSDGSTSGAYSNVAKGAVGNGGSINVTASSLSLTNGAALTTGTGGWGDAGSVNITVSESVSFDGVGSNGFSSGVFSSVREEGVGNGGGINVTTGSLSLTNGAVLAASTLGQGDAGSVNITATDIVSFDGVGSNELSSGALSSTGSKTRGNGGDINITTDSLSLTNGAQLDASTFGQGDAGSVNIRARESVSFDGVDSDGFSSGAFSDVGEGAVGNGGGIRIITDSLSLTNGAQLIVSTLGRGDAGSINITARESVSFDGVSGDRIPSAAFSSVEAGAVGKGGDINITTGSLSLTDGGQLAAVTRGQGNAGNVNITASDRVAFDGIGGDRLSSGAFSTVEPGAVGNGGGINITTGSLSLNNKATLTSSSAGEGDAGDLQITAPELVLNNQATIKAETLSGNGGDITLNVPDLLLMRHNSLVSTSAGTAGQGGDGGNMTINARFMVAVPKEDSDIRANAYTGRGGNIDITTAGIFGFQFTQGVQNTPLSDISASSELGVQGAINIINTIGIDPSQGLTNLPTQPVDASQQIASNCPARGTGVAKKENKFIITGRGGLPPSPNETLQGESIVTTWVTLDPIADKRSRNNRSTNSDRATAATAPNTSTLTEAQGWMYGSNGEVILTNTIPNVMLHSPTLSPVNCSGS